jgi:hypothetical protein
VLRQNLGMAIKTFTVSDRLVRCGEFAVIGVTVGGHAGFGSDNRRPENRQAEQNR